MAGENHFQEAMAAHNEMVDTDEQPWKSVSSSSATALESIDGCFECNICLDHAQDPVVTLCGHLYCWPCMYKWLHIQSASSSTPEQYPRCPVCKAEISQTTLVPLYGRGNPLPQSAEEKKGPFPGLEIPRRPPPAPGVHALITTSTSINTPRQEVQDNFQSNQHHQQYYPDFNSNNNTGSSPMFTISGTTNAHPLIGMFGEMVYARMFGNAAEMGLFGHPNSYYLMSSSNPRVRRQEMKAEKSLNRISIFLFCCAVLCLLSF